MFIPIPTGMNYTSTVSGSAMKVVPCEQCTKVYLYQAVRSGTGTGSSPLFLDNDGAAGRAQKSATQHLMHMLDTAVDVVPCPNCGWYQKPMVLKARRDYARWMVNVGACLTVGLVPVAVIGSLFNAGMYGREPTIPWPLFWAGIGLIALTGIGLIIRRWIVSSRYDPNQLNNQASIELGRTRAVLLEELQRQAESQ